tara:strand:- start:248 stop:505 length:258 start_codon:yes stop_codon:yes gene_type:complete
VKADTYFANLETEIREHLKDEEVQRDLVRDMAVKMLARHSEVKAFPQQRNYIPYGNPRACYVEFSDALIDGVTAIIMDELRKSGK